MNHPEDIMEKLERNPTGGTRAVTSRKIRLPRAGAPAGLSAAELEKALAEDRVTIVVQPQVDLATGSLVGVETLARIAGEDGRLIPPGEFIPLAEKTGLMRPLGRRLFALACAAARRLEKFGRGDLRVAINLSAKQLGDPAEVGLLLGLLAESGARPAQLEVELTESCAIQSFPLVHQQLQRFRRLGVSVAIDDFGTGFSSLAYLLELEVDRLKIDRMFIAALDQGSRSSLADSMIELGRKLSLDVIAEGVETEAQASWLRQHQCPSAQGFLFARPIPLDLLLARLPHGSSPPAPAMFTTLPFPVSAPAFAAA
jgi:EAL domain-containing protein (putative c-di-GMP-specific phosphodiesterase class I)